MSSEGDGKSATGKAKALPTKAKARKSDKKEKEEKLVVDIFSDESLDALVESVVGDAEFDPEEVDEWADEIMKLTFEAMKKKDGFKLAVLVEIKPTRTAYCLKMKHLSVPNIDSVRLFTKKTEHLVVCIYLVLMKYG